jgi:hypothetical protein
MVFLFSFLFSLFSANLTTARWFHSSMKSVKYSVLLAPYGVVVTTMTFLPSRPQNHDVGRDGGTSVRYLGVLGIW